MRAIIISLSFGIGILLVITLGVIDRNHELVEELSEAKSQAMAEADTRVEAIRRDYAARYDDWYRGENRKEQFTSYENGFKNAYSYAWVLQERGEFKSRYVPHSAIIRRTFNKGGQLLEWEIRDLIEELEK